MEKDKRRKEQEKICGKCEKIEQLKGKNESARKKWNKMKWCAKNV